MRKVTVKKVRTNEVNDIFETIVNGVVSYVKYPRTMDIKAIDIENDLKDIEAEAIANEKREGHNLECNCIYCNM